MYNQSQCNARETGASAAAQTQAEFSQPHVIKRVSVTVSLTSLIQVSLALFNAEY